MNRSIVVLTTQINQGKIPFLSYAIAAELQRRQSCKQTLLARSIWAINKDDAV
ncbi:hypothetical protein [Scytonema sp. PCC 10023]|uniref:hypothetical protein n=1 Tax=Scytonema sp. PCC 10023 TaxID=1680591 RepID=UPI0039C5CB26